MGFHVICRYHDDLGTSMVREITESEFEQLVKSEKNLIVEFSAAWCGPCKVLAPLLEGVSGNKDLTVVKVDVDEEPNLTNRFKIRGVPTTLVYKAGECVDTIVGVMTRDRLLKSL